MDWRPLADSRGVVTDVKFDSDGRIIIRSRQNVDPILDINKIERNHGAPRNVMGNLGRKIATIPNTIIHKWLQEDGINVWDGEHQVEIARKLNDPDWRYLRTGGGNIGVSNGVAR